MSAHAMHMDSRLHTLYEVEDRNPVADGREQTGAIWGEEKVASAVDGAQQVGELGWLAP